MRRLLSVATVLAALWCGWWWLASSAMSTAVAKQLDDLRAKGWNISVTEVSTSGFPFNLRQDLDKLSLVDPSKTAFKFSDLTLEAKAYWPGHVTLTLPQEPITIIQNDVQVFAQFDNAQARLRLRPGLALQLQSISVISGPLQINAPRGNIVIAQELGLFLRQNATSDLTYDFTLDAVDLAPGDALRATLDIPPDAPNTFDTVSVAGSLRFDQVVDRGLLNGRTPQLDALALTQAEILWGDLGLSLTANAFLESDGTPEGTLNARIQSWEKLLEYVRRAGGLSEAEQRRTTTMLTVFANMSGTGKDIDLVLESKDGALNLNGIALGPTPALLR